MLEQLTLADIIRRQVALGSLNPRGFNDVNCAVCGDVRGRGAFKFDEHTTGYTCWNCPARFKYEEGSGRLSKTAREVLGAFGITNEHLINLRSSLLNPRTESATVNLADLKQVRLETPEIELPPKSHRLGTAGHEDLQEPLVKYLLDRRVDPLKVDAHYSLDPSFLRRVILPYYRDGKIIYWQARAVDSGVKRRYLNASAARSAVLYGFDQLYTPAPHGPLFVTEGIFDAIVLDGVGLLGSDLSEAKIQLLRRCRRRIIFVEDRDVNGGKLAEQVLQHGWELTHVDRAQDANDSVIKYGLPFTIYTLLKNATNKSRLMQADITHQLHQLSGRLERRL